MEDKDISRTDIPATIPDAELRRSRPKKRKKKRGRKSPNDIRARKRDKRKAAKKRGSGGASVGLHLGDDKEESTFQRAHYGAGQLKRMLLPSQFSLLDAPEETI